MEYGELKPGLEEVVNQLNVGDGVVIEHVNYLTDRTMGYVSDIKYGWLELTPSRKALDESMEDSQRLKPIRALYRFCGDIRVVDPVKKD